MSNVNKANKTYWVDFECFCIEAKNEDDAYNIAKKMVETGSKIPEITNVEWTGEEGEEIKIGEINE